MTHKLIRWLKVAQIKIIDSSPSFKHPDPHKLVIVEFDTGDTWTPSYKEVNAINKTLDSVYDFNLANDGWSKTTKGAKA